MARNAQNLKKAILEFKAPRYWKLSFACDLAVLEDIPNLIKRIKDQLGEIKNIHWNAFHDIEGTILETPPLELTKSFHIRVSELYCDGAQACLGDLEKNHGSILSTNGIFCFDAVGIDSDCQRVLIVSNTPLPLSIKLPTTYLLMSLAEHKCLCEPSGCKWFRRWQT